MFPRILLKICLIIFLLSACNNEVENASTINIKIYTAGLGIENDNFPQDIIDLWSTLTIQGKQIVPIFELTRIDQSEEITLTDLDSGLSFIPPEPIVKLDREKVVLQNKKIEADFSQNKSFNINLANERIAKYPKENVFYLKCYLSGITNFENIADLFEALKARIGQESREKQEYIIVYKLIDQEAIAIKNAEEKKADEEKSAEIKKWQGFAKVSKQAAESAVIMALTAEEAAQKSLQRAEYAATSARSSAEEAKCDKARSIAAKAEFFKQTAENAKNEAENAAKDSNRNNQKASQYAEATLQTGVDKQAIETSAKAAEAAAAAADKNMQIAKAAADAAARAAESAEQNQQIPNILCQKIQELPKYVKKDNVRKSHKKPNVQSTVQEAEMQQPNQAVNVEETATGEFASKENKLHQIQERLSPYINQ